MRTAIELWFRDADPVSILALSYAAHEIIHRLYRRKGLKDLLFDSRNIREERRDEFNNLLKEWPNFIKHAQRESSADDAIEDFNPRACILWLAMCITGLDRMGEARSDLEEAFMFWLYLNNPTWFPQDVTNERIPVERLEAMREMDKQGFLEGFLQARREQRARGLGANGKPI